MISSTPSPRSLSVAFAPGNGEPVVGREDDERVVGQALLVERARAPRRRPGRATRALGLKAAMSRRVAGVSGRFAGRDASRARRAPSVGSK